MTFFVLRNNYLVTIIIFVIVKDFDLEISMTFEVQGSATAFHEKSFASGLFLSTVVGKFFKSKDLRADVSVDLPLNPFPKYKAG